MLDALFRAGKRLVCAHCSGDQTNAARVADFFRPRFTRLFWVRLGIEALLALLLFSLLLKPCVINGESMMPTYPPHGFTFCKRWSYFFRAPERGDVVVVRYSGRVFFLKRVVALPGETVAFHRGILFVNGTAQYEPYVRYSCNWEIPPKKVAPGHYYVVGDNRSQSVAEHRFGQVLAGRIIGAPL